MANNHNNLRKELGISQQIFCRLIHCHPSQLSMAESGRRELPTESFKYIRAIIQAQFTVENTEVWPVPMNAIDMDTTKKWLREHLEASEFNLLCLQRNLVRNNEKMGKTEGILRFVILLKENPLFWVAGKLFRPLELLEQKVSFKQGDLQLQIIQQQISLASTEADILLTKSILQTLEEKTAT